VFGHQTQVQQGVESQSLFGGSPILVYLSSCLCGRVGLTLTYSLEYSSIF
jgi:hypothetical protein